MVEPEPGRCTRRDFVGSVLVGGAGALAPRSFASPRAWRANERLRVGVIGLRGRGKDHLAGFRKLPDVAITALCDVDQAVLDAALADAGKRGEVVQGFRDARQLFDAGVCDAVAVATPNHTHALLGVWAAEHGLHAYVEKPLAHDIWQGRQLVAAAARHRVVVQTGSQCRSHRANQEAIAFLRRGELGAVTLARGLCYKPRQSIGKVAAPVAPPASVDYDLWLGPAAEQPVRRRQFHYDWHWQWAFGNGDLGNQGVHQMDLARWGLGQDGLPPQVLSVGARLGYDDDGETPNSQVVFCGYAPAPLVFEVRGLPARPGAEAMDRFLGAQIGVVFHCEHGAVVLTGYDQGHAVDLDGKVLQQFRGGGDHFADFVAAIRANDPARVSAPAAVGHTSAALCHLGNQSHRAGAAMGCEPLTERLRRQPAAAEAVARLVEHLRGHGLDLDGERRLVLGALLRPTPDGRREPRPVQRQGFVVPELAPA